MFIDGFEKNAESLVKKLTRWNDPSSGYWLPGQETYAKVLARGASNLGDIFRPFSRTISSAFHRKADRSRAAAAHIQKFKRIEKIMKDLNTENELRKVLSQPTRKFQEKGVERLVKSRMSKELFGQNTKQPNFVKRHPYLSAALAAMAAYQLAKQPRNEVQHPQWG